MLTEPVELSELAPARAARPPADDRAVSLLIELERTTRAPAGVAYPRLASAHLLPPAVIDTLVEQQPAAVLVADRDGQLLYRNEVARRLGADVAESLRWALTRAILTEDGVREDAVALASPDGCTRRCDLRVTPVRDEAGGIAGAVLTLHDVTAARRMAEWEPVIATLMNL